MEQREDRAVVGQEPAGDVDHPLALLVRLCVKKWSPGIVGFISSEWCKLLLSRCSCQLNPSLFWFFFAFETHLEGGEPHQPVQAIVVRRYETRPPVNVSRFALELVLLPNCLGVLGIPAQGSLEDHLGPFLGDAFQTQGSDARR